jgi:integrase
LAQLFARAVKQFFDWTDNWRLELQEIEAITVAAYIEQPGATVWKPTRDAVRGPRYVVRRGETRKTLVATAAREGRQAPRGPLPSIACASTSMRGSKPPESAETRRAGCSPSIRKGNNLTTNRMDTNDVLRMITRRAKAASLPYSTCCHTFRATGITTYLKNGGTLGACPADCGT